LLYKELEILSKESDIVVFHSVDIPYTMVRDKGEYLQQLYNQINYLKNMQKLVVRIASVTSEEMYNLNTAISDVVMRFELERKDSDLEYKLYVWRRGLAKPFILGTKDLMECVCEIAEKIKQLST
jgi:pyridoxal biosynthesis lyase PdxS